MSITESGTSTVASAWDRYAVAYQDAVRLPADVVSYGPGLWTETELRLLGPMQGKRFLDLGCGGAQAAIACAKQGAIAIGVDLSVEMLAYARRLIEHEEVRVELKHGDLAELAFQRADSVDVAFSAFALHYVPDLNRVFRQVHRVLKPQAMLVFSIPHPLASISGRPQTIVSPQPAIDATSATSMRSYFDQEPLEANLHGAGFVEYHRTISEIFTGLVRSGYRVDTMVEPDAVDSDGLPRALIVRARKEA